MKPIRGETYKTVRQDQGPVEKKTKKILVCDDNVDFLKVVAEMLKVHGHEPLMAKTGQQAIQKATRVGPDLVLLDYRLPDMDGAEVLRQIRQIHEKLPVIIMTGFGHEKLAAQVIKLGAMDYLVKPFKSGELLQSVENSLRQVDEERQRAEIEKLVFWGKLFPMVAHEIRTPLHSIGGAVTLIKSRHQDDEITARSLQIIHEEIVRLNEFVNQCLDFSRPAATEGLTNVDLNEAVDSCVQLITPFLKTEAKEVGVKKKLDKTMPPVFGNPHEIKQVLINLLKNAVESIPKQGQIVVETLHRKDEPGGSAEIRVIDNGMGIKQDDMGELFTPFFSRKRSGIGLGLAICKKIIEENHHGRIRIDSKLSEGTTITVTLPVGSPKKTLQEVL
jgi:signal transduction histidine kinase